jgi:hypothetical protein
MSTQRRFLSVLGVVVLTGAALGGCSTTTTLDRDKLHSFIENDLIEDDAVEVTDADCPEVEEPEVGQTFECTAQVEGQDVRIGVTVTDAEEGIVDIESLDAILVISVLESGIADDLTEQLGFDVTIECSDEDYLVAEVASVLTCEASDGSGETAQVAVTVDDAAGNVSFEIVES